MTKEENAKQFADALRATADLVERGLIEQWAATINYDIETRANPLTGAMKSRHTGWQTVTIVLRGNPQDLRAADWDSQTAAMPAPAAALQHVKHRICPHGVHLYGDAKCERCEKGDELRP